MTALSRRLPSRQRFLMALVVISIGACALPLAGQQTKSPDAPNTDLIRPGDWLRIHVPDALPQAPINDLYQVEASGKVALGPEYGRVRIEGKTLEQAEKVLSDYLAKML